jgi:twitching motility protein PilT
MVEPQQLLLAAVEMGASDLHCSLGAAPRMRANGSLNEYASFASALDDSFLHALESLIGGCYSQALRARRDFDCAFELEGIGRFRCNVFLQSTGWSVAFRILRSRPPTLADLELPPILSTFAELPRGLVLVTGPTGSGKSTTLAALIHQINCDRAVHIITIEDPIEYRHASQRALIHQREVGTHAESFEMALRGALRQDPDVIMVGELRDRETIGLALTAAETGHLVFGTIHSMNSAKTIDRIIDVFPGEQQPQVRSMVAESVQAIITQSLIPGTQGLPVPAVEVLIATPAVRNLIREGKIHQLPGVIQVSRSVGMQTMESHIRELAAAGKIRSSFPS